MSRLAALLPYVNVQDTTTAVTEQTVRPAKRRKPSSKFAKEPVTADKETNDTSAAEADNN